MEGLGSLLTGNIPVVIMMLVGVALLVVEMYVPGFGAPGISGIILLVLGFVLLKPPLAEGLILFAILAAILCVALSVLNYFIVREGVTHTDLRPAGIGEFDGVKLNVVSDGEFVAKDKPIRVQSVEGNRIVVREITEGR